MIKVRCPTPPSWVIVEVVEQFNCWNRKLMTIVTVKNKYQVVLPQNLREQVGIQVGDLLEAKVERGRITFTPKSLVDRGIAESLDDFRQGRTYGPFASAREAVASMKKELRKGARKGGQAV